MVRGDNFCYAMLYFHRYLFRVGLLVCLCLPHCVFNLSPSLYRSVYLLYTSFMSCLHP